MITITGVDISDELLSNYLSGLIDQFFKILPMRETGEPSLKEFMRSLQLELLGCKGLIEYLSNDSMFLSLIAILQYMIDEDCEVPIVKREVFKAISICKKLRKKYCGNRSVIT